MMKPSLSVEYLVARGFVSGGKWLSRSASLTRSGEVPSCAGVYAFSVAGRVMYVGLASGSLTKRLYFYQNPGRSQSTNIRLNALIVSAAATAATVDIHYACPPNSEWFGLPIHGAEGLEAGLIAMFDLPWNRRGTAIATKSSMFSAQSRDAAIIRPERVAFSAPLGERVEAEIVRRPRQTEAELAQALFGRTGYQQKVNAVCRKLVQDGRVRRVGNGGQSDPFVYVLAPSIIPRSAI